MEIGNPIQLKTFNIKVVDVVVVVVVEADVVMVVEEAVGE
jgi:hypothetical protein